MAINAEICSQCCATLSTNRSWNFTDRYPHHHNLASLEGSAVSKCPICRWLALEWKAFCDSGEASSMLQADAKDSLCTVARLVQWYGWYGPRIIEDEKNVMVLQYMIHDAEYDATRSGLPYIVVVFERDATQFWGHEQADWTGSTQSLDTATSWYQDCIHNHELCKPQSSQWRPSRLLLLHEHHLALAEAQNGGYDEGIMYAALSHRWIPRDLQLGVENADTIRNGVAYSALKQEIKDAALIALHLGLKYLWVDTLCILQDDPKDRTQEIQRMDRIYSNAACTLGSWNTHAPSKGLFSSRSPHLVSTFSVHLPIDAGDTGKHTIRLEWDALRRHLDNSVLARRGWVFQERLLSPRLLYCGSRELHWECREAEASETYPEGKPAYAFKAMFQKPSLRSRIMMTQTRNGRPARHSRRELWREIVSEYTRCSLTIREDRLVALTGISTLWGDLCSLQYAAGLWVNDLYRDLLWTVEPLDGAGRPERMSFEASLAPTWSWASTTGHVGWPFPRFDVNMEAQSLITVEEHTPDMCAKSADLSSTIMSKVLKLGGRPFEACARWNEETTVAPFSRSSLESLLIVKLELQAVPATSETPTRTWASDPAFSGPYPDNLPCARMVADHSMEGLSKNARLPCSVTCLPLMAIPSVEVSSQQFSMAGLVLSKPKNVGGSYRRLGVFLASHLEVPYSEQIQLSIE